MKTLSGAEEQFLVARQAEAERLKKAIDLADKQIKKVSDQIDTIQPEIDALLEKQRALGRDKQKLIKAHNLTVVKREYADVCRDVTKLLQKKRGKK